MFPENENSVTPLCFDAIYVGLLARVVQYAAEDVGRFDTRLASMFSENEANVTLYCADATYVGL